MQERSIMTQENAYVEYALNMYNPSHYNASPYTSVSLIPTPTTTHSTVQKDYKLF